MSDEQPILVFQRVSVSVEPIYDSGLSDISFELLPGDLALVKNDRRYPRTPLADAAQGLVEPVSGEVRFDGLDWRRMSADRSNRNRGRFGSLYDGTSWVNNLDVDENVTLCERHHSGRSIAEINSEALKWAEHFGLEALPNIRPSRCTRDQLQRAACVRALLGSPAVIILQEPPGGLNFDVVRALASAVQIACQRGAAVLWTTSDPEVWGWGLARPTLRGEFDGDNLVLARQQE